MEDKIIKTSNEMRLRSGGVDSRDPLVAFLYTLIRDHITPGVIEDILVDHVIPSTGTNVYSNGWLANYAKDIATRLRVEKSEYIDLATLFDFDRLHLGARLAAYEAEKKVRDYPWSGPGTYVEVILQAISDFYKKESNKSNKRRTIMVYELEKFAYPPERWSEVPQCVVDVLGKSLEEASKEVPLSIGHTPETGWFILMSGQGPFIFWIENPGEYQTANDGRRDSWTPI
jgi:hypothetical protein